MRWIAIFAVCAGVGGMAPRLAAAEPTYLDHRAHLQQTEQEPLIRGVSKAVPTYRSMGTVSEQPSDEELRVAFANSNPVPVFSPFVEDSERLSAGRERVKTTGAARKDVDSFEPGVWTSIGATLALVIFFFLRRVT